MIIPGISIASFAALSASLFSLILMCAGTLHSVPNQNIPNSVNEFDCIHIINKA